MNIMGEYVDGLNFPICNAFKPKILDGELCYALDLKGIKSEDKVESVRSCMDCSLDPEPHPRRPHTPGPLHRGLGVQASPQDRNWYRGHSNFIAKNQKQK